MLSKISHGSEWEVTEDGREKEVVSISTLPRGSAQILISQQRAHPSSAQETCWLPLPSVPLKEMISLPLLCLLTAMVVIFGDSGPL